MALGRSANKLRMGVSNYFRLWDASTDFASRDSCTWIATQADVDHQALHRAKHRLENDHKSMPIMVDNQPYLAERGVELSSTNVAKSGELPNSHCPPHIQMYLPPALVPP